MKPTSARKKLKTSLMAASLIAMVGAFGCGKVKTQDEKVLKIEQNSNSGTTDTLMSIATLLELYGRPGADSGASAKALNADEIKNILKKLKTSIETALHVDNLPVDQIIDTVVKVFPSLVKGVTPQDVYNGVLNNFPLVSWYQGKTDITQEDLLSKITSQFKEASPAARDGLYKVLLKFDNVSLAGNR